MTKTCCSNCVETCSRCVLCHPELPLGPWSPSEPEYVFRMVPERAQRDRFHDHGKYTGPAWQMNCLRCALDADLTAREQATRIYEAWRLISIGRYSDTEILDVLVGTWENGRAIPDSSQAFRDEVESHWTC